MKKLCLTAIIFMVLCLNPGNALTPEEIGLVAQNITVVIKGVTPGTGVIIAKRQNTYFVLTARHVIETEDEYTIDAPDGRSYPLNYKKVQKNKTLDLAVFEFTSNAAYNVANLGDSDRLSLGSMISVYGFPNGEQRFSSGTISEVIDNGDSGYNLIYQAPTKPGMSGGPVLNSLGQLVGIHGQGEGEKIKSAGKTIALKDGFNKGIPIQLFKNWNLKTKYVPLGVTAPTVVDEPTPIPKPSSGAPGFVCPGTNCK